MEKRMGEDNTDISTTPIKRDRPSQAYWDLILDRYFEHENENYKTIKNLPRNVDVFLSPQVPWKYQNARIMPNAPSSKLAMIRVWTTTYDPSEEEDISYDGDDGIMMNTDDSGPTVLNVVEVTGLYYNDNTMLFWDPGLPPTKATLLPLGTTWTTDEGWPKRVLGPARPIDNAHLDVVLFNIPRVVVWYTGNATVKGTVREVLDTLYKAGIWHSSELSGGERFRGLGRSFPEVVDNSTRYSLVAPSTFALLSPERAKWQAKIKDVVGEDGLMNFYAGRTNNRGETLARESAFEPVNVVEARRQRLQKEQENRVKREREERLGPMPSAPQAPKPTPAPAKTLLPKFLQRFKI